MSSTDAAGSPTSSAEPDIRAALRGELRARMRARDAVAVPVLRTALAAIENAEAQPLPSTTTTEMQLAPSGPAEVDRRLVTDRDARAIVGAEVAELEEVGRRYRALGQEDAAATVDAQAAVLGAVLSVEEAG